MEDGSECLRKRKAFVHVCQDGDGSVPKKELAVASGMTLVHWFDCLKGDNGDCINTRRVE